MADILATIVGQPHVNPKESDEVWQARIGAQICKQANDAYMRFSLQSPLGNQSPYGKIAAAKDYGDKVQGIGHLNVQATVPPVPPYDARVVGPGGRRRQGGLSLKEVFIDGGASYSHASKCEYISDAAEEYWWSYSKTFEKNNFDLPAWCGIFAFYVYKKAGISIGWENYKNAKKTNGIKAKLRMLHNPEDAFSGCIGVEDYSPTVDNSPEGGNRVIKAARNHHFIVVHNDTTAKMMYTIDGNLHGALDRRGPILSTVGERRYHYSKFKKDSGFMFPNRPDFPNL